MSFYFGLKGIWLLSVIAAAFVLVASAKRGWSKKVVVDLNCCPSFVFVLGIICLSWVVFS